MSEFGSWWSRQGQLTSSVSAGAENQISSKNWGGGKNMHSVLEGSPFCPIRTSRPKRARWLCRESKNQIRRNH